jgi:prepilin-type N-terminal cleavage/methylation domain-containing protein
LGFTLLELLVTLVLIVILCGLSFPAVRTTLYSDELETSARKLTGLITETSQLAMQSRTWYQLRFDLAANRVTASSVDATSDEEQEAEKTLQLPDSVRLQDLVSSHGGKKNTGDPVIFFSPRGYVDKTYIHLRSGSDSNLTLLLSPFLGSIEVADSYVPFD